MNDTFCDRVVWQRSCSETTRPPTTRYTCGRGVAPKPRDFQPRATPHPRSPPLGCVSPPLLAHEWNTATCIREEMEYALEDDAVPFRVCREDQELEVNRFAGDWITLYLFATLFWLTELHQSAYTVLKTCRKSCSEDVPDELLGWPENLGSLPCA